MPGTTAIAPRQRHSEGGGASGLARTLSCTLVSSRAKPYLDAVPVPPRTNETGAFPVALQSLRDAYGPRLPFQVVAADAAQCTRANDALVCQTHQLDYLLRLKDSQPTLYAEARRLIGPHSRVAPHAESHEVHKPYEQYRRLYISSEIAGYDGWEGLRTVLRVDRDKLHLETGELVHQGTRYFICCLPQDALSPKQWLQLIRCYWAVENEAHNSLDTAFAEDRRPWVTANPQGMVAILLLRRLAYNILALFRGGTLRSEENRKLSYHHLFRWIRNLLEAATDQDINGLRTRKWGAASKV